MLSDNNQLCKLISLLEKKLAIQKENELKCCGISSAQYSAFVEIGRLNCISLNELAAQLDLDDSTMSRTVNNLVNEHLVERTIDKKDRRCICIELTIKGRSLYQEIEIIKEKYLSTIFENIPDEKRMQVLESLQILVSVIEGCCAGEGLLKEHPSCC